jgi:hypothetical protein
MKYYIQYRYGGGRQPHKNITVEADNKREAYGKAAKEIEKSKEDVVFSFGSCTLLNDDDNFYEPKRKALEVYNKFYNTSVHSNSVGVRQDIAKESALICIKELISQNNIWISKTGLGTNNYLKEVEKELKKLKP